MVTRLDAGDRDLAGSIAQPGHQHQSRHLVLRRLGRRPDRHLVAATWSWRAACVVPAVIALLAIYVRARCPESPYWVRLQDRKRRIADARAAGQPLDPVDQEWTDKALGRVPLAQLFAADMWRNTVVATFIACCSTIIYGTVAGWMPIYLAHERHWQSSAYGMFYIWWGLVGFVCGCSRRSTCSSAPARSSCPPWSARSSWR
jgi:sugar phosphate permease